MVHRGALAAEGGCAGLGEVGGEGEVEEEVEVGGERGGCGREKGGVGILGISYWVWGFHEYHCGQALDVMSVHSRSR